MSTSGLHRLPIEYISLDYTIPLAVLVLGFIQASLYIMLDLDNKIYSFFLGSKCSSIQEQPPKSRLIKSEVVQHEKQVKGPDSNKGKHEDGSVSKDDVDVVLRSLGMLSHPSQGQEESPGFEQRLNCSDAFDLFEEMGPTEEEVRAAFDVFDENRDGFIDAGELQRLLCALGFREGQELEICERMIKAVDENGDDKIDFIEFVKIMQTNF